MSRIHARTTDLTFRNASGDVGFSIAANDEQLIVIIPGDDPVAFPWASEEATKLLFAMEVFVREAGSLKHADLIFGRKGRV